MLSSLNHRLPLEARASTTRAENQHVGTVIGLSYEAPDLTEDSPGTYVATLEFPETEPGEGNHLEEFDAEELTLFTEVQLTEELEDSVFDSTDALQPPRPQRRGPTRSLEEHSQGSCLTGLKARLQARQEGEGIKGNPTSQNNPVRGEWSWCQDTRVSPGLNGYHIRRASGDNSTAPNKNQTQTKYLHGGAMD